ncbi:unnamed protein product [Mesocestoides corti]|uniref:Uncharacterized protein n=2 Tax=Mesocestoides corti TaxID=53468 RepID=A0A158QTI4_MESCO|nr:unnamed protein product [Mesocestoides corti]
MQSARDANGLTLTFEKFCVTTRARDSELVFSLINSNALLALSPLLCAAIVRDGVHSFKGLKQAIFGPRNSLRVRYPGEAHHGRLRVKFAPLFGPLTCLSTCLQSHRIPMSTHPMYKPRTRHRVKIQAVKLLIAVPAQHHELTLGGRVAKHHAKPPVKDAEEKEEEEEVLRITHAANLFQRLKLLQTYLRGYRSRVVSAPIGRADDLHGTTDWTTAVGRCLDALVIQTLRQSVRLLPRRIDRVTTNRMLYEIRSSLVDDGEESPRLGLLAANSQSASSPPPPTSTMSEGDAIEYAELTFPADQTPGRRAPFHASATLGRRSSGCRPTRKPTPGPSTSGAGSASMQQLPRSHTQDNDDAEGNYTEIVGVMQPKAYTSQLVLKQQQEATKAILGMNSNAQSVFV